MRSRSVLAYVVLVALAFSLAVVACGGGGFESQSKVTSVRMFGVRADKPFAKPGESVTFEVLAADGRRVQPRPLKIYWLPLVCVNPRDDLYYLCFAPGAQLVPSFGTFGDADAGVDVGGLGSIPTGTDLSAFLPQGNTFSFTMPDNVVIDRPGSASYGLAIVFNIACAGQVRLATRTGNNPQQIPIECTDEAGKALGPDDFVIGINRVYSYADRTNTNPVVEKVTLDGVDVDLKQGITVDRCFGVKHNADCKTQKIDVRVSDASWEPNPGSGAGSDQREQIWATYYSDVGQLEDEARLLFDSTRGRVTESGVKFRAPSAQPSKGTLWIVVHDNRAGASFLQLPITIK